MSASQQARNKDLALMLENERAISKGLRAENIRVRDYLVASNKEIASLRSLCRKVAGWRDADGVGLPLDLCRELCAAAAGRGEG